MPRSERERGRMIDAFSPLSPRDEHMDVTTVRARVLRSTDKVSVSSRQFPSVPVSCPAQSGKQSRGSGTVRSARSGGRATKQAETLRPNTTPWGVVLGRSVSASTRPPPSPRPFPQRFSDSRVVLKRSVSASARTPTPPEKSLTCMRQTGFHARDIGDRDGSTAGQTCRARVG